LLKSRRAGETDFYNIKAKSAWLLLKTLKLPSSFIGSSLEKKNNEDYSCETSIGRY
jgi:hypothetical protein